MESSIVMFMLWVMILRSQVWAQTFTLNLKTVTENDYSTFLANIRSNVRDPSLVYGNTNIPVMGDNPKTEFLRIDFKVDTVIVSVAVRRSDLYVVGYLANNELNKPWAYYFDGLITTAQLDTLFKEVKGTKNKKIITEYKENYKSLETAAKESRKGVGLGIDILGDYIAKVDKTARQVINEAKFMLVAIQMVPEAIRFGYIEGLILSGFPYLVFPDDKVLILENNWETISKEIKGSDHGVFPKPVELKCDGVSTPWVVTDADELNMGLLKHVPDDLQLLVKIVIGIIIVLLVSLGLLYYGLYGGFLSTTKTHGFKNIVKSK